MIRIRPDPGEIEPAIAEGQRRPVGTRLVQRDLVTEPLEVGGRDNVDVMRGIGAGPGEEDAPVTGGEARPIDARFVQDHLATERVAVGRGCHVQMVGGVRPRPGHREEHVADVRQRRRSDGRFGKDHLVLDLRVDSFDDVIRKTIDVEIEAPIGVMVVGLWRARIRHRREPETRFDRAVEKERPLLNVSIPPRLHLRRQDQPIDALFHRDALEGASVGPGMVEHRSWRDRRLRVARLQHVVGFELHE